MSRWADWFAIAPEEADGLLAISGRGGDGAVLEVLQRWLERREELDPHVEMDKAWEPIHRCLTGDHTIGGLNFEAGEYPLKLCVLGGFPLLTETARSAALVMADEVTDVAGALAGIDLAWLSERFFRLPDHQFYEVDDLACEWAWTHFRELPPFFARAAAEQRAVVCTISH